MKTVKLFVVMALAFGWFTQTQAAVVLHTDTYNGSMYKLIADDSGSRISWLDAQAAAVAMGGNLVTINDIDENNFVLNAFASAAVAAAPADGGGLSLWIGLNDYIQEGQWVWADGSAFSYSNWHFGEPRGDYDDEDFAGMTVFDWWPGTAGQWHDIIGDWRFNDVTFGVVEIDVPVTTPIWLFLSGLFALFFARTRKQHRTLG